MSNKILISALFLALCILAFSLIINAAPVELESGAIEADGNHKVNKIMAALGEVDAHSGLLDRKKRWGYGYGYGGWGGGWGFRRWGGWGWGGCCYGGYGYWG